MTLSAVTHMPTTFSQSLEQAARTAWHADPVAIVLFAIIVASSFAAAGWRAGGHSGHK
jgi:hypothetical protein